MTSLLDGISDWYTRPAGDLGALIAAGGLTDSGVDVARRARVRDQFYRARDAKYNAKNQPRSDDGRFRKILARLKQNLGDKELEQISHEIDQAEHANDAGDYTQATESARNVIKMIDNIKQGALDPGTAANLREGNRELAKVMAYLPLPQGKDAAKVRFSDLPPSAAQFIQNMIKHVNEKINADAAERFTEVLRDFMAGGRTMSADELSSELARLLKVLS